MLPGLAAVILGTAAIAAMVAAPGLALAQPPKAPEPQAAPGLQVEAIPSPSRHSALWTRDWEDRYIVPPNLSEGAADRSLGLPSGGPPSLLTGTSADPCRYFTEEERQSFPRLCSVSD
jgi:hypothetical protein